MKTVKDLKVGDVVWRHDGRHRFVPCKVSGITHSMRDINIYRIEIDNMEGRRFAALGNSSTFNDTSYWVDKNEIINLLKQKKREIIQSLEYFKSADHGE